MKRTVELYFCDFAEHIDISFLDMSKVKIKKTLKGDPTPSGKGQLPYNVISIEYVGSDLLDEYDSRITTLIEAVGGEKVVEGLVEEYQARIVAIIMGIPCKTSEWVEDGYISRKTLKKLYELGLEVHLYYT